MATFRFSNSETQAVFALGCCAVGLGLLQQVAWLQGLPIPERHRTMVRLAITWRLFVVVAMVWSFAALAASQHGYLPEGLHGGDANAWFGTERLAIAGLAVGCLCGVMTAPWLRLNRIAQSPLRAREFLYATIAGIPLALYTAYECSVIIGLVDIATQGVLIGTLEPVTVSSGFERTDISRGNALNSLFVARSIRAWVGATLALIVVSIVARNSARPRVHMYSCLFALVLASPAVLLVHWLAIDGYQRVAPHFWLVHHWPSWHAVTLAVLPLGTVAALLSIKRQGIELSSQDSHPVFLCDSYVTYVAFMTTPVLWIWETIRTFLNSEFGGLMVWAMDGMLMFVVNVVVSEAVSPAGGMLLNALALMSLGAMVSRWRHRAAPPPRSLTIVRAQQVPLFLLVSGLVVLVVMCTVPFGVSLLHVGI
ncbi:MAG: hypothetical protein AAGG48_07945 [Planctomycetota bacterium]